MSALSAGITVALWVVGLAGTLAGVGLLTLVVGRAVNRTRIAWWARIRIQRHRAKP